MFDNTFSFLAAFVGAVNIGVRASIIYVLFDFLLLKRNAIECVCENTILKMKTFFRIHWQFFMQIVSKCHE